MGEWVGVRALGWYGYRKSNEMKGLPSIRRSNPRRVSAALVFVGGIQSKAQTRTLQDAYLHRLVVTCLEFVFTPPARACIHTRGKHF
ncbi:hypothetical protein LX36DRAFT_664837 [Colletotrichum falcatum]|nr:hypothetical protein LX36DRAFT_664837 [Colletotrichum falcatum]